MKEKGREVEFGQDGDEVRRKRVESTKDFDRNDQLSGNNQTKKKTYVFFLVEHWV